MSSTSTAAPGNARLVVLILAMALAAVTAGAALWFGVSWAIAANDDSLDYARARDEVLRAGQQGIASFNTLDYRTVDEGLDRWQDSATGPLLDELLKGRDDNVKRIKEAKTKTEAKILDGAVTELDNRAGKAKVIAATEVVVMPENGQQASKRNRFLAELTRTEGGWKLSAIGAVPVG